jgi:hypothetical protein
MRYQVLVELCREVLGMQASTHDAAAVMERMIGIYDQAAQSILNQSLISASAMVPRERGPEANGTPAPAPSASHAADTTPAVRPAAPVSAAQAKRLGERTRRR